MSSEIIPNLWQGDQNAGRGPLRHERGVSVIKEPVHYLIKGRADIVSHLSSDHGWNDVRGGVMGEELSPDPLGWHRAEGGYVIPDSELLAIHRELHGLRDDP